MTLVVTHNVVTGAVADPTAIVDGPAWDANHTLTGVASPVQGGTGVANDAASTITITGSFGITFSVSATTSVTFPTTGTLATLAGTEALTNKTYNKVTITAPATSATLTIPDGVTLTGPAASGTAMTLGNAETVTGAKTFGSAGAVGKLKVAGTTSGSTILDATAVASGTLTLPAATDTLVGKATTDTLTNKTLTSPVLTTPDLGTPSAVVLTNATGTAASLTAGTATNAVNVGITNDTTTNATMFPTWVTANTGNLPLKVSSTALAWNPSTSKLGIGNAAPNSLLHVGPGLDAPSQTSQLYLSNTGTTVFTMRDSTNDIETFLGTNSGVGGIGLFGTRTNNPLWLQVNSANNFVFWQNAALSINNTTDPGAAGISCTGNIAATTSIKSSGATSGIGYATGAGGTQTQITSKATGVTLNTICGAVTTHNASLAAATIVSFVLTNSAIAATDVLVLNHISGGTMGSYTLNARAAAGSATIDIRNNTAGALGEAMVIQFVVIKGVNS